MSKLANKTQLCDNLNLSRSASSLLQCLRHAREICKHDDKAFIYGPGTFARRLNHVPKLIGFSKPATTSGFQKLALVLTPQLHEMRR